MESYAFRLSQIEARIQELSPELKLPPRFYKPSSIFARGEFPRPVLAVMREEGAPPPVSVIARRMLAAKGIDLPDRWTFERTKNRPHNALSVHCGGTGS